MKLTQIIFLLILIVSFGCTKEAATSKWSLVINEPNGNQITVLDLPNDLNTSLLEEKSVEGYQVIFKLIPKDTYAAFEASISSSDDRAVFLSLVNNYKPDQFIPYNFNGVVDSAEIYRQSPHDVDAWIVETIAMQSVPLVALKQDSVFSVAVSDSPFKYENFTTQAFYPEKGLISLSSGDNAQTPGLQPDTSQVLDLDYNAEKTQKFTPGKVLPYYHAISPTKEHVFKGILFQVKADDLNALRKETTVRVADYFSNGRYTDYYGALAFTTAYFNLRKNDSKKSKYWVIPAVEYGNTQYGRDAFWIATMLPDELAAECLKSELSVVNHYAEYPLFAIIWAYRAQQSGFEIDLNQVQAYVDAVELRAKSNEFYSYYEGDGRLDFQYWGDVMAFEKNDVIAYNQGLFALAIEAASQMGLTVKSDPEGAAKVYSSMYNQELGFYPVSKFKSILSPDALVPDLLAQLYFNKKLLPSDRVKSHFDRMVNYSKTPYGFKVVSTAMGEYLPDEMYDIPGYISQVNREDKPDGWYFRGGSYFLYDNLFLLDAYLHGIPEAEDLLKWRIGLDFEIGSTTYEYLNTVTGEAHKPNMGWNVAIYAFWRQLVDEGRADQSLFEKIDQIVAN